MADVPSPEGSPSRLRRDPSFSLGGNIDAFYKGASAAIAAAFVLTLVVLSERSYVGCRRADEARHGEGVSEGAMGGAGGREDGVWARDALTRGVI